MGDSQADQSRAYERIREIVKLVEANEIELEESLDLLEEGVELVQAITRDVDSEEAPPA